MGVIGTSETCSNEAPTKFARIISKNIGVIDTSSAMGAVNTSITHTNQCTAKLTSVGRMLTIMSHALTAMGTIETFLAVSYTTILALR